MRIGAFMSKVAELLRTVSSASALGETESGHQRGRVGGVASTGCWFLERMGQL